MTTTNLPPAPASLNDNAAAPGDSPLVPLVLAEGEGGEYQGDAVADLASLLDSAGARVSFDRGRSNTHPCTFCGKAPTSGAAHQLLTIGRYLDGSSLTRPVCSGCEAIAGLRMMTSSEAQLAREKDWRQYVTSKSSNIPDTERDTFAFAWAAGAASGGWRDRAKDAEQRLVEALVEVDRLKAEQARHAEICSGGEEDEKPGELDRLNPFKRGWIDNPVPVEPAARFIHGVRYYAGMLEDGDQWWHSLGHIESCCKEFGAAIEAHRETALPALLAQAAITSAETGVTEFRAVDVDDLKGTK